MLHCSAMALKPLNVLPEGLDRDINVGDPRKAQDRFHALAQLPRKRCKPLGLRDPLHRAARHVLADHVGHPHERRVERVSPHRLMWA